MSASWDKYFYAMAQVVASNSKCYSRKIGAVLVRDKTVMSTGYNGPPRGVPECDSRVLLDRVLNKMLTPSQRKKVCTEHICPRYVLGHKSGEGLHLCPSGHAERNALINAARLGICTKDTILYLTCGIPCSPCLVEIINAGVQEVVCTSSTYYDDLSVFLAEHSHMIIRVYENGVLNGK